MMKDKEMGCSLSSTPLSFTKIRMNEMRKRGDNYEKV